MLAIDDAARSGLASLCSTVRRSRSAVARGLTAALLATGIAGCLDIDAHLQVKGDGNTAVVADVRLDQEMQHVFAFVELLGQQVPQGAAFLRRGLCPAVEFLTAFALGGALDVQGKQGVDKDKFICSFSTDLGPTDAVMASVGPQSPAGQVGVFVVKPEGPKRYRVTLDLGVLPDLSAMATMQLAGEYMKKEGRMPDSKVMERFQKALEAAMPSMMKLMVRDGVVEMTITAPKIVETNGKSDGKTVKFVRPWTEFATMLVKADTRKGKTYFAVIEY